MKMIKDTNPDHYKDKDVLEGMVNELMKLKPFGWVFIPKMKDAVTVSVDNKPIVLCQDCKHYFKDDNGYVAVGRCDLNHESIRSNFFCADGENGEDHAAKR
jgi:hypothetical protein